jgi:hypothetical protein
MESDDLDREFVAGYFDGRDLDCPEPSDNRHPAYVHSFNVGRAEKLGNPIPAWLSRLRAQRIEQRSNSDNG